MADRYDLHLPALEIRQGPARTLYSFAVDGKQLLRFTTIARTHRTEAAQIRGYQRPEVLAHIAGIRRYLESPDPMIPNALVVAFDERVQFQAIPATTPTSYARFGTLIVPIDETLPEADKPGWLVDGQQRAAAIQEAALNEFPICVTAFITGSQEEQRSQFILVNSTKPLPKSLLYELLPATSGRLPDELERRRLPAALLDRLNFDEDSPFYRQIRTMTTPSGVVKDNSILKMLEHSITDGALYRFRDPLGSGDLEAMLAIVKAFWTAVATVFPEARQLPPRKSRLLHGVGIVSLGAVMDTICDRFPDDTPPTTDDFVEHLQPLIEVCCWTSSEWVFAADDRRRWDQVQNTPKDVRVVTDYLLAQYRQRAPERHLPDRRAR